MKTDKSTANLIQPFAPDSEHSVKHNSNIIYRLQDWNLNRRNSGRRD